MSGGMLEVSDHEIQHLIMTCCTSGDAAKECTINSECHLLQRLISNCQGHSAANELGIVQDTP